MASCFPIYTSRTGSKRNARESNAILGLNAHSSFKLVFPTAGTCRSMVLLTYVTRSEKTDHVLHATKNEIMIVFISTSKFEADWRSSFGVMS